MTGHQIVLVITPRSANTKTGPMRQAWILLQDVAPLTAVRSGQDAAICGGCTRRGLDGDTRTCYVNLFTGPTQVWKHYRAGGYPRLAPSEQADALAGEHLRIAAYGDPAVLPFLFWKQLLARAAGWTGYTSLWSFCDPAFKAILMASCHTQADAARAGILGWKVFRARKATDPAEPWEVVCPASEEGGSRVTCIRCQLCRGQARPSKPIVIIEHGAAVDRRGHVGRAGLYLDIYAKLDAGHAVVMPIESKRQFGRMWFAIQIHYRRKRETRQLAYRTTGKNEVTMTLGIAPGPRGSRHGIRRQGLLL